MTGKMWRVLGNFAIFFPVVNKPTVIIPSKVAKYIPFNGPTTLTTPRFCQVNKQKHAISVHTLIAVAGKSGSSKKAHRF